MRTFLTFSLVALAVPAVAQQPTFKVGGLFQVWGNQILNSDLRDHTPGRYTSLRSEWREDGFSLRRTELKVSANAGPGLDGELLFDPSLTGSILQDAFVTVALGQGFSVRAGQYKSFQTLDGATPTADLPLADRSEIGRLFGDVRERGASLHFTSDRLKASLGFFNGDPKNNDANPQKDVAFRVEFVPLSGHLAGVYGQAGRTSLKDVGTLKALTFTGSGQPSAQQILENRDRFSQVGAFYQFKHEAWTLEGDVLSGTWGRRQPAVGSAAGAAQREHLDQRFLGVLGLATYRTGRHTFALRGERFDANAGRDWYGPVSPYQVAGKEELPVFTETTFGYAYALAPAGFKYANLKLNLIHRGGPWLTAPGVASSSGDDLLVALQFGF